MNNTKTVILAKEWSDRAKKSMARTGRTEKLSNKAKAAKIKSLFNQGGTVKVAEAMVGPINIRVNYEGIARQALVEDTVDQGVIPNYAVMDELPSAYVLNSNDGEVKVSRIEGKTVIPQYGRISSEYEISRTDVQRLSADIQAYAENMTVQQIMKEEDNLLYKGYELALSAWQDLHNGDVSNVNTLSAKGLTLDSLLDARGHNLAQQSSATNVIINPADFMDVYRWDITTAGPAWKDDLFAGYNRVSFAGFNIIQSITVPRGRVYVTAPADNVGIFSTMYGLEATPDPTAVANFMIKNIFNELVSVMVINNIGISKIEFPTV
jgi:hypothetical protein